MASCKICNRKESKRRVINDMEVCSECCRSLKENNYELKTTIHPCSTINDSILSDKEPIEETSLNVIIKQCIAEEIKRFDNMFTLLYDHIAHLEKVLDNKMTLMERLVGESQATRSESEREPFKIVDRNKRNKRRNNIIQDEIYIQESRYQPLYPDDDDEEDKYIYNDDANLMTNNYATSKKSLGLNAGIQIKRPQNVIKENPLSEPYFKKTVPGNASYSEITRQGKKKCLIGDSIIKRIDMREFNRHLDNGTSIKRSFAGATALQLQYYMEEVLNEENPDMVVINIGTNNITKKQQSEEEIVKEILGTVDKCRIYGVNEIFVSGLTCRPMYQTQVNKINTLLRQNTGAYEYKFIDNSDIMEKHLWKDRLHLNDQGIINLACNFLDSFNKRAYFENFY